MLAQTALKYDAEVNENGYVDLSVAFAAGARMRVFVVKAGDTLTDLFLASQSSLGFWDNPLDDEDWNNA